MTSTEQGYIQNDWTGITIGSISGTGGLTVGGSTWSSPLTLQNGSGGITVSGAQTMGSHNLTLQTDGTLAINANLSGTGTLSIAPASTGTTVGVNGGSGTLNISNSDLGNIQAGFSSIVIGSATGFGNMDINAYTWNAPVTFQSSSGNMTFESGTHSSGSNAFLADTSGNITLASGAAISSTASGNAIILAAGGNFINNSGSNSPLTASSGNWLVYSTAPNSDTNGASVMNPTTTVNSTSYPTTTGASGNTWFYSGGSIAENITLTATNQTVTYGTAPNTTPTYNTTYTCTAGACADMTGGSGGSITISGSTSTSGNYTVAGGHTITLSGVTPTWLSGYSTGTITYNTGTLTVNAATLTISGVTANNKTYDAGTTATLNTGSAALAGKVGGDTVTLGTGSATGTFASANVANGITVNTSGFSISGADSGNYSLTQPSTTANITAAGLTVTASNVSGTYGTSSANTLNGTTGFSSSGLQGGQTIGSVTLATNATSSTSGNYNANTGANPASWTITPSAATGGTFNANNYSITYDTGTQTITPVALTISGMTATSKTYDGTNAATVNNAGDTLSGVVSGHNNGGGTSDAVGLNNPTTGTFSQSNVGNGLTVTGSGLVLSGADSGNYTIAAQPTATANITAKGLTISGMTASNKVYDSTTTATLNNGSDTLNGVIAADSGNVGLVTTGASGAFGQKDVGNGLTVTGSGFTLSGSAAGNYTIASNPTTTANITPATLTVTGVTANNKVYDSTTTATLSTAGDNLVGVYGGDTVTLSNAGATGTFASKNVANGITVAASGFTVSESASRGLYADPAHGACRKHNTGDAHHQWHGGQQQDLRWYNHRYVE